MENEALLALLKRECELLNEAEKITDEMQTAPAEDLPGLTSRRGRFLEEAHHLRQEETQLCGKDAEQRAALDNTASPVTLSPALLKIYQASMAVRAAVARLQGNGEVAQRRLAQEKDLLQQKLDSLNSDSAKTVSRYAKVIRATGGTPHMGRDRKI